MYYIYYWRDHKKNEIDLLIDLGGRLATVEIKSSRTYNAQFFKTLSWFQSVSTLPIEESILVYGGNQDWEMEHGKLVSWEKLRGGGFFGGVS